MVQTLIKVWIIYLFYIRTQYIGFEKWIILPLIKVEKAMRTPKGKKVLMVNATTSLPALSTFTLH